jgi:hypothetical protein
MQHVVERFRISKLKNDSENEGARLRKFNERLKSIIENGKKMNSN